MVAVNPRNLLWPALAGVLAIVFFAVGFHYGSSFEPGVRLGTATMEGCIDEYLKATGKLQSNDSIIDQCFRQIEAQQNLDKFTVDASIALSNEISKGFNGRTLLWVVVGITLSGVALAALQLLASYNMASSRKDDSDNAGELTLAADKIVLKSSVTGLFILVISFAFFLTYMNYTYSLTV